MNVDNCHSSCRRTSVQRKRCWSDWTFGAWNPALSTKGRPEMSWESSIYCCLLFGPLKSWKNHFGIWPGAISSTLTPFKPQLDAFCEQWEWERMLRWAKSRWSLRTGKWKRISPSRGAELPCASNNMFYILLIFKGPEAKGSEDLLRDDGSGMPHLQMSGR